MAKKPPIPPEPKPEPISIPGNIYLVGGAVRDELLGLPHPDKDWVVVGARSEDLIQSKFLQVGKDFPIFLHPVTKEEYALARTERKTGKGYYGFEVHASPDVTLEQDLSRRDITINAIAKSQSGEIIDPFGGVGDIKNKIIRHVSPAFVEDPVRILRVARFMARFAHLGFKVAAETLTLMKQMVDAGEVDALVPERVWQEMERALLEPNPDQFILTLKECKALERLWPELNKLWGIPQKPEYHPEIDTGVHVMMTLSMACKLTEDPIVRFAALCHDLGKGATNPNDWPSHKGHEELGVPIIKAVCERFKIPNQYRDLAVLVSRYHLQSHRIHELRASTLLKLVESLDLFRQPERLNKFILACEADYRGRLGAENKVYTSAEILRKAFEVAKDVPVKPLLDAGYTGEQLGEQLRQKRIRALIHYFKDKIPKEE